MIDLHDEAHPQMETLCKHGTSCAICIRSSCETVQRFQ